MNFSTFSVRGCWGQPMLLFWKPRMDIKIFLSQNSKTTFKQDFTYTFQSVRANSWNTVQCETPCSCNIVFLQRGWQSTVLQQCLALQIACWLHRFLLQRGWKPTRLWHHHDDCLDVQWAEIQTILYNFVQKGENWAPMDNFSLPDGCNTFFLKRGKILRMCSHKLRNVSLRLLYLVSTLYTVIHKTQKS